MSRKSPKKPGLLGRFLLWSFLLGVAAVLCGGLYAWIWVKDYLRSDALRVLLAGQLGRVTQGQATLDQLTWSGPHAYVPNISVTPDTPWGWGRLDVEGTQALLDWSGVRQGVWRVPNVSADWLRLELAPTASPPAGGSSPAPPPVLPETPPAAVSAAPSLPGWLRAWIPTRTEIGKVDLASVQVTPPKGVPGVRLEDIRLVARPTTDEGAWALDGEGGELRLPGITEPFRLNRSRSRLDTRSLAVNDASARWLGDSEVTGRGNLPFDGARPWGFSGVVMNLDLRHVVTGPWQSRLEGLLEADYEAAPAVLKGKIRVKNGVIQRLPVLERIADFTRAERFRRVVLDEATADVERTGAAIQVRKLVLQSSGLLRIEGDLTLQGGAVNGLLFVGVSPETLRWLPGAQGRVFTDVRAGSPPGFVWTTVRLAGPVEAPQEDLSNRLLAAAGKELIESPLGVATTGVDLLNAATGGVTPTGEAATKLTQDMLKTTQEAAGGAVETGVNLLKGAVPLFGN